MAIPTKIKQLANDVRNKIYGIDVRESIAKGMEESGRVSDESMNLSEVTENRQTILETKYNVQIAKATDITEIKDFRVSGVTGETFNTMGQRADYFDSQFINNKNEFKQRGVNILWFQHLAVESGGGYDWTAAIQTAIDELEEGTELFIPKGKFYFTNLVIEKDDVTIRCLGTLIQYSSATGTAIKIGSSSKPNFRVKGNINARKQVRDWNQNNIGIELVNMNEASLTISVREFTINILLLGDNQGTAYNTLYLQQSINGQKNLAFERKGEGWVNENRIFGGRMTWLSDVTEIDKYHVYIPDVTMNNNTFFSLSMEGRSGGTFVYNNGRYNHFYTPRLEGNGLKFHFGEGSIYNTVFYPYGLNTIEGNTESYKDEGSRNHIFGRDEIHFDRTHMSAGSMQSDFNPNASPSSGEAGNSVKTISSSIDKAYQVKNALDVETFTVRGDGAVKGKSYELNNGMMWGSNGMLTGNHVPLVPDSYTSFGVKIVAIKKTAGPPSSPEPLQGVGVLNVVDSKIYFHMGNGVWKGIQLA